MNWTEIGRELDRKLDPANVKKPTGNYGPKGDYIEGWHAIAEANRIFGHGGWSYVIKSMTQDALTEGKDSKGNPQWQAAYTCIVTLTVGGVVREDVGFGSGFARQIGDAVEGATKEAVTDALKRALRTFGNPFGLALYDKSRANVGVDGPKPEPETEPKFNSAAERDRLKAALLAQKIAPNVAKLYNQASFQEAASKLPEPMRLELSKVYNDHYNSLLPDDPAMQAPQDEHMYG